MPNPPFELTLEALDALAIGAWILGTGGGGDPYFSLLEAREQLAAGKRARVIDPLSLADDALVACVGQMGAPLVKQERLVDGPVIASTITMMEEYLGRKFEAVMLWEIGGNNGFQAILSGMLLDLPIVDCDAMGRAFPQADMTTFSICELTPYPWTMVDIRRNRMIFVEAEDWSWMERMTRRACTVIGSSAATCKAPRTGARGQELHLPAYGDAGAAHRADGGGGAARCTRTRSQRSVAVGGRARCCSAARSST